MTKHEFYRNLPVLETERLFLRRMTAEDTPDVYEYASDPEVPKYLRWDPHKDIEATGQYVRDVVGEYETGTDGPWVIVSRHENRVIGAIHIYRFDEVHRQAEIGYVLNRNCWNRGYMTEALKRVIDYCFDQLDLHRVQAICKLENPASARVLEKAGMICEGTLRRYLYEKGRFWDVFMYSVIK